MKSGVELPVRAKVYVIATSVIDKLRQSAFSGRYAAPSTFGLVIKVIGRGVTACIDK
jgi:hypothetical protein